MAPPEIEDYERLSDESDMATQREGQFLSAALDKAMKAKPVHATGFCLDPDCDTQLVTDKELKAYRKKGFPPDAQRFCNAECRDSYEKHLRMRKITGWL